MRRKEKEITDFDRIEKILKREKVCRLALANREMPYLVPLSYGYSDNTLYFHSAAEGKKIDILTTNPKVCFEVESNLELVSAPLPCKWGMKFETVIGYGTAEFILDPAAKIEALKIIINHYRATHADNIPPETLEKTTVFKVKIESVSGKKSGI